MKKFLHRRLRHKQPLEVRVVNQKSSERYLLAVIALISLCLNFFIVYTTIWPHYGIEIREIRLDYDSRAYNDIRYFDSLYVDFQVYNSGNKPISIFNHTISFVDPSDTNVAIFSHTIYQPPIIAPYEIKTCTYSVKFFRKYWTKFSKYSMIYKPKLSQPTLNYRDIIAIYKQTGLKSVTLSLSNEITLKISLQYNGTNKVESYRGIREIGVLPQQIK